MYITAQGPRLRNDLYCVEWDVKLYYTQCLVVQERSRVSPASRGRVPLPRIFIYLFLIWKWRVLMHSWWYFMRF